MITWENYEEYMMMHADGELNPAEEQALRAFVKEHPALEKELAAYELTRVTPDTTMVFTDKQSLRKPLPAKKIIAFPQWKKYSIAAGIAAIIFISLFKYVNRDMDNAETAKVDTVKPVWKQAVDPHVTVSNVSGIADNKQPVVRKTEKNQQVNQATAKAIVHQVRTNNERKEVAEEHPLKRDNEPVMELQLADTRPLWSHTDSVVSSIIREVPAFTVKADMEEDKETFWDRLPIDDLKKDGLRNVASTIANGYEQVSAIKKDLYKKSISIRVEKRKLIISL